MSNTNPGPYFPPYTKYHTNLGGKGWARYDDTEYTSSLSSLTITAAAPAVVMPNNAGNAIDTFSNARFSYYNGTTNKIQVEAVGEQYNMIIAYHASTSATNNCYFTLALSSTGTTPYDRVSVTNRFAKANNETQDFYHSFHFYADADFVANGNQWNISCAGADMKIWNVIYYIERIGIV